MRQKVAQLGAEIDAATPSEVAQIVAQAFSTQASKEYDEKTGIIQLDGSGNGITQSPGQHDLTAPGQYDWKMERVTLGGQARAASALVLFYRDSNASDTTLKEVVQLGTAGLYSDSFSNEIHIPANSKVVIVVTGGPANGNVTFNLQIRLQKRAQR